MTKRNRNISGIGFGSGLGRELDALLGDDSESSSDVSVVDINISEVPVSEHATEVSASKSLDDIAFEGDTLGVAQNSVIESYGTLKRDESVPLNSAGICRKPGATSTTIEYVELLKQGHVLPVDCDVDAFASALKVIVRQHQFFSFENGKLTLSCDETDLLFVMVSDLIKTVVENFDTTRQNLSSIATSFGPSICHSLDPVAANVAVKHFFEAKYPHLKQIRDKVSMYQLVKT